MTKHRISRVIMVVVQLVEGVVFCDIFKNAYAVAATMML